jgi:2-phospho-L-lactate guanylyltransferase
VDRLAIVSPDEAVLQWASHTGGTPLRQRRGELNAGLELGREWATRQHADALLVLLGDLPLIEPEDVRGLYQHAVAMADDPQARDGRGLAVVVPDRSGRGTNALLLKPAEAMPFAFGPRSCERHLALARNSRLAVALHTAPRIAFDVDQPADLMALRERGWCTGVPEALTAGICGRSGSCAG